jgi:hypothetical protein
MYFSLILLLLETILKVQIKIWRAFMLRIVVLEVTKHNFSRISKNRT